MSRPPSRSPQRRPQGSGSAQRPDRPESNKQHVLHFLFDRPGEPVFLPKGDSNAVFDVPSDFIAEEYRPAREGLINRIKEEISENIPVKRITVPDPGAAFMKLGRRDSFSLFMPNHRKLAARLIDILVGMRTYDDFLSAAVYFRDRVNPHLYNYALSVAILHRPDTNNVQLPPLFESFPDKYIDGAAFKKAREVTNVLDRNARFPIEIPRDYTASDMEPEHKIAYFREDLGVNLHHWHWHLVYPFDASPSIVNKDRRGELFYYMHQQIISRYNFERLCNGMSRVERLTNFRNPIAEGYFSKLDSLVSSRVWMPRHANAYLSDVNREIDQIKFDLSDLERWRDRILDSIAQGAIVDESGGRVELDETTGIDILGNIVESSILSRNRNYYGDLHNFGHLAISLCHDPDGRHLETFGVMGDPATAMRDPVFYKWHAYIDYIFQQHKSTLPPYSQQTLEYPGIRVTGFEVNSRGRKNELYTFWDQNDVNLSRGIDFTPRGNVFARINHLQHQNFSYRITIENSSNQNRNGTARIFMAPKMDERGLPWLFVDQRHMFIELDKFPVTLKPNQNVIERKSTDSSVTIPFETTFRNLDQGRPTGGSGLAQFNFCGCGWPQHMLIPRGAPRGFECELFIMISNIEGDRVQQTGGADDNPCNIAQSYCGLRDKKYPDRRAMGFPFDRNPRNNVDTLRDFLTSNMAVTDVRIIFEDTKGNRQQNEIRGG
ncbi:UNVERIFIED_CONTAM: hypothetical protein PYX00_009480 [Menopon gallinae]|uniref:Tyrosinase copper-binding domain-containing protein n=1 Tax=Menopon gallinae TaxID=328185 RepID=A0AAW2HBH6_9NEOP